MAARRYARPAGIMGDGFLTWKTKPISRKKDTMPLSIRQTSPFNLSGITWQRAKSEQTSMAHFP